MTNIFLGKPSPPLSQAKLDKRGLLYVVFDGRYKFARYFAATAFNTPRTLEEIVKNNDVQLFDLESDPEEMHNLALQPDQHKDLMLRLNALLNDLVAKEVGENDGAFLHDVIHPK
jgi:arylsulfatase